LACFFGRMNHVAGQGLELGFDQWPGDGEPADRRSSSTSTTTTSPSKPDQAIDHHRTLGHAEVGRSEYPLREKHPVGNHDCHGFSSNFNQLPISPCRKHIQRIPYDVRLLLIAGWLKSAIVAGSTPLRDSKIVAMSFRVSKDTPSKPYAAGRNSLFMLQRCYYNVA